MTLEDDVRKCCEDIEGVRNDTERLKKACDDEARKDLSEKVVACNQRLLAELEQAA